MLRSAGSSCSLSVLCPAVCACAVYSLSMGCACFAALSSFCVTCGGRLATVASVVRLSVALASPTSFSSILSLETTWPMTSSYALCALACLS